jgi:benzoyl-CoA reductase subunit B
MWLQKELINKNYMELAHARANNRKVAATFVPGNLNELLMCFDFARSLPETNALQNGMRKKSERQVHHGRRARRPQPRTCAPTSRPTSA